MDDWNSFMQSRLVRVVLYSICAAFGFFYALAAVPELLHPERQAAYVEAVGTTAFYAITVVRMLVMVWVGVMFARMALKAFQDKDE